MDDGKSSFELEKISKDFFKKLRKKLIFRIWRLIIVETARKILFWKKIITSRYSVTNIPKYQHFKPDSWSYDFWKSKNIPLSKFN